MKKQYKYVDWTFGKHFVYIYHDGELVESKELWTDDFIDEVDRLESEGYKYGYTKDEVKKAQERYEHILANIIIDEFKDIKIDKETAIFVKRFKNYNHEWWAGLCPRCNSIIKFDFELVSSIEGNRRCYCSKCGQLCDFEDR